MGVNVVWLDTDALKAKFPSMNVSGLGAARTNGAFIAGALSGFGTMAACATGALCAAWVNGTSLPDFAPRLSLSRYDDENSSSAIRILEFFE